MRINKKYLQVAGFIVFGAVLLTKPNISSADFTVVVLPDIQGYTENFPQVLNSQTQWIANNKVNLNIKYVIQNGDLVEHTTNSTEWTRAVNGMSILDGVVPYGITVGNHDLDDGLQTGGPGAGNIFRQNFPISKFSSQTGFGAYYNPGNVNRNSWYSTFSDGGLDFLVFNLEWEAPDDVLTWASGVIQSFPNHRVIVAMHHYLNPNPAVRDNLWPWPRAGGNLGEDIWHKFVKLHPNIFMVHSGHIFGEDRQISINNVGNQVHEIVVNYHPSRPNGGDGWLRYYTFKTSINEIHAFSFSPWRNQFENDANSQFILNYNMSGGATSPPPPPPPPPTTTAACNLLDSTKAVPAGFAASYNVHSAQKGLIMDASCHANFVDTIVGNGSSAQYIYNQGYLWTGSQWSPYNYSCQNLVANAWCVGFASHRNNIAQSQQSTTNYYLAFICDWNNSAWKCGCRDQSCSQSSWNLQAFRR
jgi:hypothetical protein